ncbi:MAG TPA: DUF2071 domain-containing protein [Pseudomonadales bacterium]|nr:DUF2071 domain-containing protein [Pseudomonadales bacterium]
MNETIQTQIEFTHEPSAAAQRRMLSRRGEPLFIAGWDRALMLHFEVNAETLQREVPFELDLRNGRAFVSLVAFTMRGMKPRFGGKAAALLFRPIATHNFLNVRTYVRHGGEQGIHFLAEWLTNRLAVMLGPTTFGLPYHHGRIQYDHDFENQFLSGQVVDVKANTTLKYNAQLNEAQVFQPCAAGSLDEWLMERYTAFNSAGRTKRFFRVWHPPWPQCAGEATVEDLSLITGRWPWFKEARFVGANFSPGFDAVWMGRPFRVMSNK